MAKRSALRLAGGIWVLIWLVLAVAPLSGCTNGMEIPVGRDEGKQGGGGGGY